MRYRFIHLENIILIGENHQNSMQFSDDSGLPRTFSQDSDSDEDVPDELKQDYIDENTGDLPPPPARKWVFFPFPK